MDYKYILKHRPTGKYVNLCTRTIECSELVNKPGDASVIDVDIDFICKKWTMEFSDVDIYDCDMYKVETIFVTHGSVTKNKE